MGKIEAVIFDWAGTCVDYGCFAPVQAFKEAFLSIGIEATNDEVREPMGMLKIEHIKTMLEMPRIKQVFHDKYNRDYTMDDVNEIYKVFETKLMKSIAQYTEVKPYVLKTVKQLREKGIKIGSTTGYTDAMMSEVVASAKAQGYEPDCWFSPDSTNGKGRPYPYMIFNNMQALDLNNVHKIIKVGDTTSDIKEGKHAGVISVGVLEGSSEMGLTQAEYEALDEQARKALLEKVEKRYRSVGADHVILNLSELAALIAQY
ncbi:MAG: phosphonoacetaldehyde hydrolase [Erysipelotrichia bacterium]|nr:phosphonoacetaldehyde hydrolase [Erysipelotrichia bacterium]